MPLRYSDFNMGEKLRITADAEKEKKDWIQKRTAIRIY